ncbi:hypothetical protein CTAYLR_001386 [Chrysophaeum taylorii]|uniref:Dihydroxyacetone kinase n=1 Tax=Chrysophaeum taylorii TaxID=2483200 RepID=A0AAD7U6A7_9STRA|nr:hypothetical protein CTAYLR_001386 [Chrysophaeum taylorii]
MECKKVVNASSGPKLTESIVEGLVTLYPEHLGRLDDAAFAAGVRVVVRRDYEVAVKQAGKVAVISGGGSGHEPAHAGFVGKGLLTAAVCGDVFASPTVKAVLCAIVAASSKKAGCLLIVKNYTGDRLNFGIAAETARSRFGIEVETVYVRDDVALPDSKQPRGLAGCVVAHKVAGAAADRGMSLEEVARVAREAAARTATMGVAYEVCSLPGRAKATRLGVDEVELGLGIHGEPGAHVVSPPPTASAAAASLVEACAAKLEIPAGARVALVVNNLGATSGLEMAVFGGVAVEACRARGLAVARCLDGALVTSIDMQGVSVSLTRLDDELMELIDRPCDSPALKGAPFRPLDALPVTIPADPLALRNADVRSSAPEDPRIAKAVLAACDAVSRAEPDLTRADETVGDGDCGTTLKQGADAVKADLENRPDAYKKPAEAVAALADVLGDNMGGSSGALYVLGLRAAENALQRGATWGAAFQAAARAIEQYGGAGIGSRTMCDATIPAARALLSSDLNRAALEARRGADGTKDLVATHGRSAYVAAARQHGVPDPGALAVAIIFEAIADALH